MSWLVVFESKKKGLFFSIEMFCWASKIIILNKIKEISTAEELLENLVKSRFSEEYRHFSTRFSYPRDGSAELRIESPQRKHLLKVRPVLHPSRKLLRDQPDPGRVLVCPSIPEPLAADLRRAGIPHADLNGRLFVGESDFLLDRRPGEVVFRNPRSGPDPFSPKASRLVRALLNQRNTSLTQEELARQTGVSRAVVSQVLAQLVDEDYVERSAASGRKVPATYLLADFDRLLEAWRQADNWQKRTAVHQFSVLSNRPEEIAQKVVDSLGTESIAFTQWFAAWLRRPHTTPPVVSAYVRQRHLLDVIPARSVNTGGNLWLIIPEDEGVFSGGQESQGFPLVGDVQIYLDLLPVGQRGPETAAEFKNWEGFAR
ncbi:MAG: MarR family transcriptional regulator [Verrucomicrobia bacterium]|nr:MarR family transcriptional regulator [Verrucomicrobiota bacterium]